MSKQNTNIIACNNLGSIDQSQIIKNALKNFNIFIGSLWNIYNFYYIGFGGDNPKIIIKDEDTIEHKKKFIAALPDAIEKNFSHFKADWEKLTQESKEKIISLIDKSDLCINYGEAYFELSNFLNTHCYSKPEIIYLMNVIINNDKMFTDTREIEPDLITYYSDEESSETQHDYIFDKFSQSQ